jgi:hypothetical protein
MNSASLPPSRSRRRATRSHPTEDPIPAPPAEDATPVQDREGTLATDSRSPQLVTAARPAPSRNPYPYDDPSNYLG